MFEGWQTHTNLATKRAKDLLKPFRDKRNDVKPKKNWNNYLYCQKCRMRGVKTKYLKETMLHVLFEYRRKGNIHTAYTHYCEECAMTYKPQSERLGTKNE
jgi:hypothetical protein